MTQFGDAAGSPIVDLAVPIRAWRTWTVRELGDGRGWTLASYAMTPLGEVLPPGSRMQCRWNPRGMEARCYCPEMARGRDPYTGRRPALLEEAGRHAECPGPPPGANAEGLMGAGYGCGIYGMRTEDALMGSQWVVGAHVVGEVELGGRVWEHELGFRAQYARVVRIGEPLVTLPLGWWDRVPLILRSLRRRYGV